MTKEVKIPRDTPAENVPIETSIVSKMMGIPEGCYECQVVSMQEMTRMNFTSRKQELGAIFHFVISEGPYKGREFEQFFTNKLTKRSKLTVFCRGVWGDEFEPEEMAQLHVMKDFERFLIGKPVQVVILLRYSPMTETVWYDIAFFLKSLHYDAAKAKVILPPEEPTPSLSE